jgi:hypothetical protein
VLFAGELASFSSTTLTGPTTASSRHFGGQRTGACSGCASLPAPSIAVGSADQLSGQSMQT